MVPLYVSSLSSTQGNLLSNIHPQWYQSLGRCAALEQSERQKRGKEQETIEAVSIKGYRELV